MEIINNAQDVNIYLTGTGLDACTCTGNDPCDYV